jgi:hypothetical protein
VHLFSVRVAGLAAGGNRDAVANPPWRLRSIVFELVLGVDLVLLRGNLRRRCDGVTVAEVGADGGRAAHSIARSQEVARWLVTGLSSGEAHQRARETWCISRRTADRLLVAARKELIAAWDIDRQDMTAMLLARLDAVFRAALAAGNHGAALGAINAAARIAQL